MVSYWWLIVFFTALLLIVVCPAPTSCWATTQRQEQRGLEMAHRLCALTPARRWLVVWALREKETERDIKTQVWSSLEDSDDSDWLTGPRANVTWGDWWSPSLQRTLIHDAAVGKVLIEGLLEMFKCCVSGLASLRMACWYFSVIAHFRLDLKNKIDLILFTFLSHWTEFYVFFPSRI